MNKLQVAVFVSGSGTNLQAILDKAAAGELKAEIAVVVSSRQNAYALERARQAGIPTVVCSPRNYPDRSAYGQALLEAIEPYQVDLVVLAGFMSILSHDFIARYRNRIMNTHPSLVPAFAGPGCYGNRVHQMVLDYGVKVTGATIMFVTEEVDAGPIILQKCTTVSTDDTVESLRQKVLAIEHELYPHAINLFAEGRLRVMGRKVQILPEKRCGNREARTDKRL